MMIKNLVTTSTFALVLTLLIIATNCRKKKLDPRLSGYRVKVTISDANTARIWKENVPTENTEPTEGTEIVQLNLQDLINAVKELNTNQVVTLQPGDLLEFKAVLEQDIFKKVEDLKQLGLTVLKTLQPALTKVGETVKVKNGEDKEQAEVKVVGKEKENNKPVGLDGKTKFENKLTVKGTTGLTVTVLTTKQKVSRIVDKNGKSEEKQDDMVWGGVKLTVKVTTLGLTVNQQELVQALEKIKTAWNMGLNSTTTALNGKNGGELSVKLGDDLKKYLKNNLDRVLKNKFNTEGDELKNTLITLQDKINEIDLKRKQQREPKWAKLVSEEYSNKNSAKITSVKISYIDKNGNNITDTQGVLGINAEFNKIYDVPDGRRLVVSAEGESNGKWVGIKKAYEIKNVKDKLFEKPHPTITIQIIKNGVVLEEIKETGENVKKGKIPVKLTNATITLINQ